MPQRGAAWQANPDGQPVWTDFRITLLDHDTATQAAGRHELRRRLHRRRRGRRPDLRPARQRHDPGRRLDRRSTSARGRLRARPSTDLGGAGTDGRDYVEGGGGNDLIFGGLGQDDLIGGSSDLFGGSRRRRRGRTASTRSSAAPARAPASTTRATPSANGHAHDADVILGDNGDIFRVVGANGQFLTFIYDTAGYPTRPSGSSRAVVVLLDYSPTGDASYIAATDAARTRPRPDRSPAPNTNIGGGDFLYGEAGDDVIHGQAGADTIFGDGGNDLLYGEAGGDWISGGTGDDGVLGDDGLLIPSRNGYAEPLYGIAATTQLDGTRWHSTRRLHRRAARRSTGDLPRRPTSSRSGSAATTSSTAASATTSLHGGAGDDAISGAEALPLYYANGRDPLGVLASLGVLHAGQRARLRPATTHASATSTQTDPFRKIMVAPGVDFLLNFESTARVDVRRDPTPQPVRRRRQGRALRRRRQRLARRRHEQGPPLRRLGRRPAPGRRQPRLDARRRHRHLRVAQGADRVVRHGVHRHRRRTRGT